AALGALGFEAVRGAEGEGALDRVHPEVRGGRVRGLALEGQAEPARSDRRRILLPQADVRHEVALVRVDDAELRGLAARDPRRGEGAVGEEVLGAEAADLLGE